VVRRVVVNSAAMLVILAGAWAAVNTPVFHARDIRITGTASLARDEVMSRAGITSTTNVIRLRPSAIETRLEDSPWIADARVTRELPSTVAIEIRERRAVATVRSAGGWAILAEDSMVLVVRRRKPALPVIEPSTRRDDGRPATPPHRREGTRVAYAEPLVRVLAGLPQGVRVSSARPFGDGGAQLLLAGGTRVRYGDESLHGRKNVALVALLRWARGQGRTARLIDVRVPEAPVLTLLPL
jgi:cell division protein FtsQ